MSVASATATFVGTALPRLSLVWRCKNVRCRRIICELEWDGTLYHRHVCSCNTATVLPADAEQTLRTDRRKW